MLIGEKVILRPISFEDWEKTLKWRNDMDIKSSTMSHPFPITIEQEQEWYKGKLNGFYNRFIPFTIIDLNDNSPIGYTNLNSINWINRNCYFGIVIGEKKFWGQGYGNDALKILFNYAFNHLNLLKICCQVLFNHPAIKSYLNLGGEVEGTLKNHYFNEGSYDDVHIISWFPKKNNMD